MFTRILLAASLSLSASGASAQFTTQDSKFGQDSLIIDTISGNTWLSLDVTLGLSLNAVLSDPQFEDFHLAGTAAVDALFMDAGYSVNSALPYSCAGLGAECFARLAAEASFASAFSALNGMPASGHDSLLGYVSTYSIHPDLTAQGIYGTWRAGATIWTTPTVVGVAFDDYTSGASSQSLFDTGTWLLMNQPVSAIPEPSIYALMLAGLGALGFAVRRRKVS